MTEYQGYQGGILQMTTLEALDHVLYYVAQTTDTDCYQLEDGSVIDLRAMAIKIIELRDLLKFEMNKPKKESLIPAIDLTQEDARQVLYNLAQKNLLTSESEGK